ncbi:MAG: MBL fold metallo-hydrolase [Marinibacterium sp.]
MTLSRRSFAKALAAAPLAAGAIPARARAEAPAETAQAAFFGMPLGRYRITAIMDGVVPLTRDFFFGPDAGAIDQAVADAGIGPQSLPAPVNTFLLQSDDRTILIDAGMGGIQMMGPGFGRLTAGLAVAGVAPEDVDTVLVTHLHPDHVGGMLGEGGVAFPNAEVILSEDEARFWTDPAMVAAAPDEAKGLFQMAAGVVAAYGDQVTLVADGAEVAPGITLRISPGHTPGHAVMHIDGGDRQLLMLADTVHVSDLHLAMPHVGFGFDVDTALAGESRVQRLEEVVADNMLIAGSHIHFPSFGHIQRSGDAYRFAPATWL